MSRPSKSQRKSGSSSILWRAALLVIVGCGAYANSLSGPFVFDDVDTIVENPAIQSFGTVFRERLNSPISGRPVVGFTFAANFALNQLDVTGYHIVNIAIHVACALLLSGIIRRTLMLPRLRDGYGRAAPDLALASALVWTVHPLNTEAVDYITQRTESLMALFYLLALYACIRSAASARGVLWQTIAVAACGLGMACKESMVTAPVMVVIYDRVFVFDSLNQAFKKRWRLYTGLALTWLVLLYFVLPGPRSGSAGFSTSVRPWTYLLNQSVMIVRYLRLVFWPRDLVIHYGPPLAVTLSGVLPYALAVGGLLLLTLLALRWKPSVGFLGLWMFLTLAPTSSIVPIATEVAAERRMYLPLMAVVAMLVGGFYGLNTVRQRLSTNVAVAIVSAMSIGLAAATIARNREYASGLVLAQTALARWPTDLAHGAVGSEMARLHHDDEAIPEFARRRHCERACDQNAIIEDGRPRVGQRRPRTQS